MRILNFIFINVILINFINSQTTFIKSIDVDNQTDEGTAIRLMQDGYLLLGGSRCFSNSRECYSILKTDYNGNVIWRNQVKNSHHAIKPVDGYGNHGILTIVSESDLFFSGIIQNDTTLFDCFIMKTDSQGDSIWLKTYGSQFNDFSSTILQRSDSTLVLFSDLSIDHNSDVVWILETDLNGNVLNENTYGELNSSITRQDIVQLNNGDIVFTHFSCDRNDICLFGDSISLNITKIDKQGTVIWTKKAYNFTEYWSFSSMISLDNGGFLLSFHRTNFENGWFYPPIFIWTDSLGNVEEVYNFPETPESIINDIVKLSSGEIIGVGYIDKFELGFAGWVFSFNQERELLWNREILDLMYPANLMSFNAVEESEDNGIVITGFVMDTLEDQIPPVNNKNIVLVKLDSTGCLEPNCSDLQLVTSLTEMPSEGVGLYVYPNPVSDLLCLESKLSNYSTNYDLMVFNYLGQVEYIFDSKLDNNCHDVSSLPNGIYFARLSNSNKMTKTFSFVVLH